MILQVVCVDILLIDRIFLLNHQIRCMYTTCLQLTLGVDMYIIQRLQDMTVIFF